MDVVSSVCHCCSFSVSQLFVFAAFLCVVPQETLQNSTSLQRRVCNESNEEGKPCLQYSTYSIHKSCNVESESCSLMLLPGIQDGRCDRLGICEKIPELQREEAYQFEAYLITGKCVCQ